MQYSIIQRPAIIQWDNLFEAVCSTDKKREQPAKKVES